MSARLLAGLLWAVLLLAGELSYADNTGRLEPLDGTAPVISSAGEPANRGPLLPRDAQPSARATPQGDFPSRAVTPFGAPLPPNQLTPVPVLPFNPNRSLMPSPSTHPPNPARAETGANPAPYSGSGRLGR